MADYYLNLHGAQTVLTPEYRLTAHAVAAAVDPYGLVVLHGPPGVGKTFALADALAGIRTSVYCFEFAPQTSPKDVTAQILEVIVGRPISGTHRVLRRELMTVLAGRRVLLSIDEAQNLDQRCVETLRWLFDQPSVELGLVLVGGNGVWRMVEQRFPALKSRVTGRVEFRALNSDQVLALVPEMHQIYKTVDREVIANVDRLYARGRLREWTIFTKHALDLMQRGGESELNRDIADLVLELTRGLAHV